MARGVGVLFARRGARLTATVTKKHRAIAFSCVWTDQPSKLELLWIEDGSNETAVGHRAVRTAQALADLEAEVWSAKERA